MSRTRFFVLSICIILLALALRLFYAFDAKSPNPIRGDSNDYVLYAWNLKYFSTFSSALPNGDSALPDSYRGPGYPLFLAGAMTIAGPARMSLENGENGRLKLVSDPATWITVTYIAQSIIGSLTVLLTIVLARFWLPRTAALASGLAISMWPHLIVFSATLLGETLFSATLMAAVVALCYAVELEKIWLIIIAGVLFAISYLVNPVIALFPFLLCALLFLRCQRGYAIALLVGFAIMPLAWSIRNAGINSQQKSAIARIEQNFVQGSWPQFLMALGSRFSNPISAQIVAAEGEEEKILIETPRAGLSAIYDRMALDPLFYWKWYLLQKPFLLWDWAIRVGWGDVYFVETPVSPYDKVITLKFIKQVYASLNPAVFGLSLLATMIYIARSISLSRRNVAFAVSALIFLYVTLLHSVLQAEPRYSIPYRPFEVLLAITVIAYTTRKFLDLYRLNLRDYFEEPTYNDVGHR